MYFAPKGYKSADSVVFTAFRVCSIRFKWLFM